MQHTQRLDQRLHVLREEVRTMTQEKQHGERAWREKLQRCQRQLKAKEEEMSRQSQYFENFKVQLQQKLSVARDREQTLQNRVYTLEKQLLEMTVNAATGTATTRAVRITAGTVTRLEEQDRLPSMRGEGEGEEEKKEERKLQWQSSMVAKREERQEDDEGKAANDGGGQDSDAKHSSNEARLQSFIISLQEDLKVLLEREEDRMTEQRGLMEQLQEAQENSHFLGCRVEEMKAEVHQLKLSESSLMEEVGELKEENHRLQQIFREAASLTPNQSFSLPEPSCPHSGSCSTAIKPRFTVVGPSLTESSVEFQPSSEEEAVPVIHHQAAAENTHKPTDDYASSPKLKTPPENDLLTHFLCLDSDSNFKPPSFTMESLDENWCSEGIFNVEESPSEESDALREALRSLGLGEDLQKLQQQRDHLEAALQHTQEQLQRTSQENAQLKSQLRKLVEEQHSISEEGSSRKKICRTASDCGEPLSTSTEDDLTHDLSQEELIQALNRENRALADRIQELFAHIELREEETMTEKTQLKENISRREDHVVRLEQENQEQACLISELTKKTEDDLNTIMELQQNLLESDGRRQQSDGDRVECSSALWLSDYNAVISERFPQNDRDKDSSAAGVLGGEEAQLIFSQATDLLSADSASDCHQNNHSDSLRSSSQKALHVGVLTDEMVQLTTSIQSLKTEQKLLSDNVDALKEQQQDVTLSVHQQTEEKKQLTRAIWGLKEEKDCIDQSLTCLKQEKEQLNRTVCGLKDKKDQFERSMTGLKQEKEQLTQSVFALESDKEAIMESLSRGNAERDQIMQSLQSLRAESDELNQAVINLKEERDKLTNSLMCLNEQRNQEQLSDTLEENPAELIKSVSTLEEEMESTVCFTQNRKQIMLAIQGPREERSSLPAADGQTPTEAGNARQSLLNAFSSNLTDRHAGNSAAQRCQTNHTGSLTQEESDLMTEIEVLGAKLTRSQEELDKSRAETKRLCSELCHSDVRREEAERKAGQAAEKVTRLSDVNNQMEEIKKENVILTTQVKQLQNKLTSLLREKSEILSLKSQTEEQYNILTAQLKAKTVALEELNSEYIALKRGQGGRDDLSAALVSLRARYNDIRAKYDVLLKRKSQTDLDIAPLKAKLSCLVMKCQERNNLLAQMMKIMNRRGFADSNLTRQVEMLLRDAALQDYSAAFTPEVFNRQDCWTTLKPEFISIFQDYKRVFIPDPASKHELSSVSKQQKNWVTPEAGTQCCGGEKHTSAGITTKSPANLKVCLPEVAPAGKKITNSPSSVQVSSPAVPPKEGLMTAQQPSLSVSGPEETGVDHAGLSEKSSPDRTSLTGSSLSRASPSSSEHFSLSRRLSSPEKILHLHEQLQKTVMSSYLDPGTRGRQQQSRRSLPISAPENPSGSSHTKNQNLSFSVKQTASVPATTASTQVKHIPAETTQPAVTNKPTTLFHAVISRSAGAALRPGMFMNLHCKGQTSKTTSTLPSSSPASVAASEDKPTSSNGAVVTSPKLTSEVTASPDAPRTTANDGKSVKPGTTASNTTAPKITVSDMTSKIGGAGLGVDCHEFSSPCSRPGSSSPEKTKKSPREKIKTDKPKPEAPAAVGFVEVIKTVGQSSLLIGWERPPLDELFCSNGTFVYGYRVLVDGDFYKSVMSSACTKCVLENVDLTAPLHISVQTLGSNGLASDGVHTTYRTSAPTEPR